LTRLKFLVFALLALGLWVAHFFLLSPAVGAAAVDSATGLAVSAPAAVALRLESNRSELQAAVIHLASTVAITNPGPRTQKPEGPTVDRFNLVRTAVLEALPESLRDKALVGIGNDVSALMARGSSDPAPSPEGFDAKAAATSGGRGEVMDAFGASYLLFSVPLFGIDRSEVRAVGAAFVGLPLVPDPQALVEGVAKDLGLSAVGLSVGGKIVASAGPRKALVAEVVKSAKPGQAISVEKGSALVLGPAKLPMATAGDAMGGQATLEIGVRRDIPGTPYEVVAIASTRPAMEALGGYQKTALFIFLGLLAAAIAFSLLLGGASASEGGYVAARVPAPSAPIAPKADAPLQLADAPPPPEASADDFNFGPNTPQSTSEQASLAPGPASSTQEVVAYAPPPVADSDDPFSSLGPDANARPANASLGQDDDFAQRTTAYPAHGFVNPMSMASTQNNAALDPFSSPGLMSSDDSNGGDNPDATRVAVIPEELLKASARGNSKENPMGPMPVAKAAPMPRVAAAVAPAGASPEDAHFQEVFRDFVSTRERCGEPGDGLTFDKFVAKLRKNKEQLVVKYNCKTVRFQVYVKEGKAALKATPVKE
jgi:hypothetical protein